MLPHRVMRVRLLAIAIVYAAMSTTLLIPARAESEQNPLPEPPPPIDQIVAVLEDADAAIMLLDKLPETMESSDLARLREIDRRLSSNFSRLHPILAIHNAARRLSSRRHA